MWKISEIQGGAALEAYQYAFNSRNRMVEASTGEGTVTSTYNKEGLRVAKTADGITTQYIYECSRVIQELDSANDKSGFVKHVMKTGQIIYQA